MSNFVRPEMEERKKELEVTLSNHLFDLDGPRRLEKEYSKDELFIGKLFYGFVEINNSYEVLLDLSVLISRFPYNLTRITRVRYLRHNIEGFLNEVYLLKERLVTFTKTLERYYREESLGQLCKKLRGIVEATLQPLTVQRGSHVHRVRYSDEDLDRLEMLELLSNYPDSSRFIYYYDQKYKELRKKWKARIDESNSAIKKLLDYYCNQLFDYVFDDNGVVKKAIRN